MLDESGTLREHDLRAELTEQIGAAGRTVSAHGPWLAVDRADFRLPGQGWKIHVSARPSTLLETIRRMTPVLLETPCHFKVVRSGELLRDLNSANTGPGSIGKAVTVYAERAAVAPLARALAECLAGLDGPRIVSDRRVRPDAPVYYRYGPFSPSYEVNEDGDLELVVTDPAGHTHPGVAGDTFWQPPWDPDPLLTEVPAARAAGPSETPAPSETSETSAPTGADEAKDVVLGGRYRMVCGLTTNGKGYVYRAVDLRNDRRVIVKEARPHVNEDAHGRDSKARLRNERYALEMLKDLDTVPGVIDHFRHGDQEYLVVSEMGEMPLGQEIAERGLYGSEPAPDGRGLRTLAARLLSLLDQVHQRGVLVRDLNPTNIVLDDASGRPTLIDFEISHVAGEGPPMSAGTPGYSSRAQERNEPATPEDDYYSLGATLYYAATGLPPTWMTGDPHNHDVSRAAVVLDGRGGMTAEVLGLLSADPAARRAAADAIRAGRFDGEPAVARSGRTASLELDEVIRHTLGAVTGHARRLMAGEGFDKGRVTSPINLYRGSAGVGVELLHHAVAGDEAARDLARALAYWTGGFQILRGGRPGLYTGDTGTAVFLAAAGAALDDPGLAAIAEPMARPVLPRVTVPDQHKGLAGIGAGQLLIWRLTGDDGRLGIAAECAARLVEHDPTRAVRENAPDYDDCASLSQTLGYAHGIAGTSHFLLDFHTATGDDDAGRAARQGYDVLADHFGQVLQAAMSASAKPMHASFCQGTAGMGASLVRAARDLRDDRYLDLARDAAAVCHDLAPRMYALTQCCGLAGIGELFLDLARTTGETAYDRQAERVARLILSRAGGPDDAPVFPDTSLSETSGDWSTGSSGILSFLRRLRTPGEPRVWLDPFALPGSAARTRAKPPANVEALPV
ncbi:class IV lanthionine synthetase LanL [Spirillospora sp. NBC_01491]|uniref:class IV lanthionine synthetase LanL n=1 Tax=Spirillospora sp. NBC_01491 TaxID=2976007 RepID=UPI002E313EBA|nr:class IV lanthionine synthetase LanL [Spirillospora sp. NBC_01491]